MIKKPFLFFYYTLLFGTALVLLLLFAATRTETPDYLAEHVLKPLGVDYSSFEGSLMEGFIIHDLRYGEGVSVKKLELRYRLAKLIKRVPQFDLLALEHPVIIPDKLTGSGGDGGALSIPPFAVSSLLLKEMELLTEDPLILNLEAEGLRYDDVWTLEKVDAQGSFGRDASATVDLHAQTLRYDKALSVEKLDATGGLHFDKGDLRVTRLKAGNVRYDKALSVENLDITGRINFEEGELSISGLKARGLRYDQALHAASVKTRADLQLVKGGSYALDLYGEEIHYDTALSIKNLDAKADTPYGRAATKGSMVSNRILSKATLMPKSQVIEKYLGFLQGVPQVLECEINATTNEITVSAPFEQLSLRADENLTLRDAAVKLTYLRENEYFAFDTDYRVDYRQYGAQVKQEGVVALSGAYATGLKASQLSSPVGLPFQELSARVSGDIENLVADVDAGPLRFDISGTDYSSFRLSAKSEQLALAFMENIPEFFRNNVVALDANATLKLSPFSIQGSLATEGRHMLTQGNYTLEEGRVLYSATVTPKPESELYTSLPIDRFTPLNVLFHAYQRSQIFYLESDVLTATLFKSGPQVTGWGGVGSSRFDATGRIEESGEGEVHLRSSTASLHELLSAFSLADMDAVEYFDAGVEVDALLTLTDTMRIKGRIDIPWYAVSLDSQRSYTGKENFVEAVLKDRRLTIESYRFDVMDRSVYSDKPSIVSFDANGTVHFEEMYLYDDLMLSGHLKLPEVQGALNLKSDSFTYAGKEGNVTAKADISAQFDGPLAQTIEGEVTVIDGVIRYAPPKEYAIHDEDIVIVQDIKAPSEVNRFVNIRIASEKPLLYDNEGVAVRFRPDVTIWQESGKYLELLGLVTVEGGEVIAGEKEFEVSNGEIYFYGAHPIDPYLNLLLRYSVEETDIEIHIANTLKSPVFIFSSTPAMSQNDIISYLLFGAPATTAFESSEESADVSSLGGVLLGTGLKSMFKKATGIKVDTLNILTSKEGTFGYEVGTRLGRKVRLVYKSETTSSLILQYSVNKWVRVDVDVYETGQGVSLLYIKDFSDPFGEKKAK